MLKMSPEVGKRLRETLTQSSTKELISIRETMPEKSNRVAPEVLNFIRNNINVLLKTRDDVGNITAEVKVEIARAKAIAADARLKAKTRHAVNALRNSLSPLTSDDSALFARIYKEFT